MRSPWFTCEIATKSQHKTLSKSKNGSANRHSSQNLCSRVFSPWVPVRLEGSPWCGWGSTWPVASGFLLILVWAVHTTSRVGLKLAPHATNHLACLALILLPSLLTQAVEWRCCNAIFLRYYTQDYTTRIRYTIMENPKQRLGGLKLWFLQKMTILPHGCVYTQMRKILTMLRSAWNVYT